MTKENIIDNIARLNSETWRDREEVRMEIGKLLSELKKALEQRPSDCVSMEVYKQVAKERDIAIEQLKELGYSFGEKIRTSEDCVSRAEVLAIANDSCLDLDSYEDTKEFCDEIKDLPPVTPAHCIAEVKFSKEELREICEERIEIDCQPLVETYKELRSMALRVKHNTGSIDALIDTLDNLLRGSEKMNEYRQNAINHLKTHLGCVGYRDYVVAELEKIEKIEQIVDGWNNDASHSFSDMCKINEILK